jgi:hypothetical protein
MGRVVAPTIEIRQRMKTAGKMHKILGPILAASIFKQPTIRLDVDTGEANCAPKLAHEQ